ncbi:MAG TPA: protease complex subunit PrcB family protein [Flavobacterium sp.]|nr:protease complex subunit PrcB family protein [Flavobacterium sp.]
MKSLVTFLIISLTLFSCNSDDNSSLTYEFVNAGKISVPNPPPQSTTVKNQTEWNQLSDLFYEDFSANVDFNTHQLIVIFDEPRPDGGYSISVHSITENSSNIIVTVQTHQSDIATQQPIQPFCIVKIPASNKPVSFTIK